MKEPLLPSEQSHRALIDHLQDGIFVIEDGKFTYVNQPLADMLCYPAETLIGRSVIDLVADEDKSIVSERHRARVAGEKVPELYDLHITTGQGTTICCSINVGLSLSQAGHRIAVGSVRDVTQQKAVLTELQASKEELKSIFDHLPDIFYRTDMQGILTKISPACYDILGYREDEMLGTALSGYYKTPEERQKIVRAIIAGGGKATRVEAALKHKNGSTIWISTSAFVRLCPDGQQIFIEGMARDVSEHKRMENQLITLTRTDSLTGIYNRGHFMERAGEVIRMMRRYQRPASMMIMDLDHFKKINDKYGHISGDVALKIFTDVCQQEIREPDIFGRLGGEEFGLMLPETTIQHAQVLAERIRKAVAAAEVPLGDRKIGITVSIGLVEVSPEDSSLSTVLHRADLAMYQAKTRGRNQVVTTMESR
ncbi:MAG TPA: sensor domain-containing diguanylate cyclase [Gallionella sp.]|nr:sensor domain-containing diguanylate cyclase [Gallionella sp.]